MFTNRIKFKINKNRIWISQLKNDLKYKKIYTKNVVFHDQQLKAGQNTQQKKSPWLCGKL